MQSAYLCVLNRWYYWQVLLFPTAHMQTLSQILNLIEAIHFKTKLIKQVPLCFKQITLFVFTLARHLLRPQETSFYLIPDIKRSVPLIQH